MLRFGWPSTRKMPRSATPGTFSLNRNLLKLEEIGTDDLDGISALYAGEAFFNIVLDVLGEVEVYAYKLLGKFRLQVFDQVLLVTSGRPCLERLQRHEEFRVEKAGRIAAIIGPAML